MDRRRLESRCIVLVLGSELWIREVTLRGGGWSPRDGLVESREEIGVAAARAGRGRFGFSGGEGDDVVGSQRPTREWTLWMVAVSCALHPLEEYFTGWQAWAKETLGIVMPTGRFVVANVVLAIAAFSVARVGWRRPALALTIPAATLVNAIFFHILPTVVQNRVSPGVYTATLLYVPFSSWAFLGAWRDGVPGRALAAGLVSGTLLMAAVVLGARWMTV
jgi:hypothetical protein